MSESKVSWPMIGAASVAVAVEAASNALFAYDLGAVFATIGGVRVAIDGALLAAGSVAIAVVQALTASKLLRSREPRRVPACVLAVCLAYSTGAMATHMLALQQRAHDRETAAVAHQARAEAARDTAKADHTRKAAEYARVAGRVQSAGETRAPSAIQAAIDAAPVPTSVLRATRQCTSGLADAGLRRACEPLLQLHSERETAGAREKLDGDFAVAKRDLDTAQQKLSAADARLADTPRPEAPWVVRTVLAQWLPWLMAIAIELCATLGFAYAARPAPAARREEPPALSEPDAGTQPRQRATKPTDLGELLDGLAAGAIVAPGCIVHPDGWVEASQRSLGAVLGVAAPTVSRQLADLEARKAIATKRVGRGQLIKYLNPPKSALVATAIPVP